jgi:hypothetical protein
MVQTFLRVYTFYPGCTLISVGRMAQGEKWSRLRNLRNGKNHPEGSKELKETLDKLSAGQIHLK